MKEQGYQNELARRASDMLPFNDIGAVQDAVKVIMERMRSIGSGEGEIVYPYDLSSGEIGQLRKYLRKHNFGLVRRIEAIVPRRLEEGMGTAFLIREKRGLR